MKKIICFTLLSFLAGCAGIGNDYHKKSYVSSHGYEDMRLSKDTYMIGYDSDSSTSQFTNYSYSLRRAAEVTKENGCKFFTISENLNTSKSHTTPKTITKTIIKSDKSLDEEETSTSGGRSYVMPGSIIIIKTHKQKVDGAFDADVILENYKQKK